MGRRVPAASRLLWLGALVLLDPLLTLVYWAVVRRGFGQRYARILLPIGPVLAVAGRVVALIPSRADQFERGEFPGSYLPRASVSVCGAEQRSAVTSRFGRSAFLWPGYVEIAIGSRSPWAIGMATAVAEELTQLPFLDRVSIRDLGEGVALQPDIRLTLGASYAGWREPFLLSPSSLLPVASSVPVRSPGWFHLA